MPASKRRTRIAPGPAAVVYALVTGLVLAAALHTQANLLFWGLGLLLGALVVSLLIASLMLRHIDVQRLLPAHGVAGEDAVIRYRLVNHALVPLFSLVVAEQWGRPRWLRRRPPAGPLAGDRPRLGGRPHGWILHLGPHQHIQAEAPLRPLRRGPLEFERIIVSTSFPFGLITRVVEIEQPATLLVLPQLYRIDRRLLATLSTSAPAGTGRAEKGGGTEDFFGLRPYRPRDGLRLVDWKQTASKGELISRELAQPNLPQVMVVLDLRREPLQRRGGDLAEAWNELVERAVSLTASLVCDAHFQGWPVGLAVAGAAAPSLPVHHSLLHRTRMLEVLARLDPDVPGSPGQGVSARPTVLVWPGPDDGGARRSASAAMILGAANMDRYVREPEGGSEQILRRTGSRRSGRRSAAISLRGGR
ncbi:MAG: DUF58 domain-containing protein [Phycisphaeraceae bacterium]